MNRVMDKNVLKQGTGLQLGLSAGMQEFFKFREPLIGKFPPPSPLPPKLDISPDYGIYSMSIQAAKSINTFLHVFMLSVVLVSWSSCDWFPTLSNRL